MILDMKHRSKIMDKASLSFTGIGHVLAKPRYVIFMSGMACILATAIYFSINSGYYGTLLLSPMLSISDKLGVVFTLLSQMGQEFFATIQGFVLLLVALFQGLAFGMMLYNMRRNNRIDTSSLGKSGVAMVAATLGLGCVPCGTSLILPLLSLIFSSTTSVYAAANVASLVVLSIALILSIYSLYTLGYIAVAHKANEESTQG